MTPHTTPLPSPSVPPPIAEVPDESAPELSLEEVEQAGETTGAKADEADLETWVARPVALPPGAVSKLPPPMLPPVRPEGAPAPSFRPPATPSPPLPEDQETESSQPDAPLPSFQLDAEEIVPTLAQSASPGPISAVPPSLVAATQRKALGWRSHPRVVSLVASMEAKSDPKWLLSGAGYLLVLAATVGVVRATRTHQKAPDAALPAAAAAALPTVPDPLAATAALAEPAIFTSCSVQKRARILSRVVREVPVEMRAYDGGDHLWVGAASEQNRAQGFAIERSSLSKVPGIEVVSPRPIHRIVSLGPSADEFFVSAETDERKTWPLSNMAPGVEGEGRIESVRTVHTPSGVAIVFRRQGEIYEGSVDDTGVLRKPFAKIEGVPGVSTPSVGAPSIGSNGRELAVVFTDRASADEPWRLRLARSSSNELPARSRELAVPPGGPGGSAITPSIVGLSDGRWLVAWTEGDTDHLVRATTFDPAWNPVGEPFDVSAPEANSGQPVLALAEGRGAIAYLVAKHPNYELWASTIACQ